MGSVFIKLLFLPLIVIILLSCDDNPLFPCSSESSYKIVATIWGNFNGIKTYNACDFTLLDSLSTPFEAPTYIENNESKYFSVLGDNLGNNYLYSFTINPLRVSQSVSCTGWRVGKNYNNQILFVYGELYNTIQLLSIDELSLLREVQISNVELAIGSSTKNLIYGLRVKENYASVFIYSIDSSLIVKEIQFSSNYESATDIAVSSDDRFVFFTTFLGSSSFIGKFYAFDTHLKQIVFESLCPPLGSIAVAPDNKSVYITDPAGYQYQTSSSGKLLKYDVEKRSMNVFIDWTSYNITDVPDGKLPTEKIVVSPDNRYLFIVAPNAKADEETFMDILKVSVKSKKVVGFLSIPPDHRGYRTELINNIKLVNN